MWTTAVSKHSWRALNFIHWPKSLHCLCFKMQATKPHTDTPLSLSLTKFYQCMLILETGKWKQLYLNEERPECKAVKYLIERKKGRKSCFSKNKLAVALPSAVLVDLTPPPSVSKDASEETNKTTEISPQNYLTHSERRVAAVLKYLWCIQKKHLYKMLYKVQEHTKSPV